MCSVILLLLRLHGEALKILEEGLERDIVRLDNFTATAPRHLIVSRRWVYLRASQKSVLMLTNNYSHLSGGRR